MNLSKSSINSNKMRNLTENKRKRQESNNNEGRENTKVLFNDILTICQNISNLKNNKKECSIIIYLFFSNLLRILFNSRFIFFKFS